MSSPCHRRSPFYSLGCVSASNRRRYPCFVVGFRLSLDLCLCCCLFLGEAVWRRCELVVVVVVVEICGGNAVVVEVLSCGGDGDAWWW
jgi:hypothetical protein